MKQIFRLLLLTMFIMSSGLVASVSYAAEEEQTTEEPECEGEDCPAEEEPECD